jgi:hypothetical protein
MVNGKVRYTEDLSDQPRYSLGMYVDIDRNGLGDIIFSSVPGRDDPGFRKGVAIYLQRKGGDFVKFFLDAEGYSNEDIFDIEGDGVFEILTARLVSFNNQTYWVYRCWNIRDFELVNVDDRFGFPRAILFTFQPNNKLVEKNVIRDIMKNY